MNSWISLEIEKLYSAEEDEEIKDTIIPQMERLVDLVEATTSHCSYIGVVRQYFSCLGINYYRVASYAVEKLVSMKRIIFKITYYNKLCLSSVWDAKTNV